MALEKERVEYLELNVRLRCELERQRDQLKESGLDLVKQSDAKQAEITELKAIYESVIQGGAIPPTREPMSELDDVVHDQDFVEGARI